MSRETDLLRAQLLIEAADLLDESYRKPNTNERVALMDRGSYNDEKNLPYLKPGDKYLDQHYDRKPATKKDISHARFIATRKRIDAFTMKDPNNPNKRIRKTDLRWSDMSREGLTDEIDTAKFRMRIKNADANEKFDEARRNSKSQKKMKQLEQKTADRIFSGRRSDQEINKLGRRLSYIYSRKIPDKGE